MKKIVSLVLALVLVMGLATTAFAAETKLTATGETADVKAKYVAAVVEDDVVSVDVEWEAMEFTYTVTTTKVWNPGDHTYNNTDNGVWTAEGNTITVTNHSNKAVTVGCTFNALEAYKAITGTFTYSGETTLARGEENAYDAAAAVTATLTLAGELAASVTEATKVGTITVTLA